MFSLLKERWLRWLDHVRRIKDGRILKEMLYSELVDGSIALGRPLLRFKDVCKRDLKTCGIDIAKSSATIEVNGRKRLKRAL